MGPSDCVTISTCGHPLCKAPDQTTQGVHCEVGNLHYLVCSMKNAENYKDSAKKDLQLIVRIVLVVVLDGPRFSQRHLRDFAGD
jgi:hypothetical protein